MIDFVIILILILIVGGIVRSLVRAKKRGETCIGCPNSKVCGNHCEGTCDHEHKK
ncbi:FeoB-associated Cys-rich membrane protein [Lachnospiraceae bacterium OttesenSCG-928-E19]|nr:FeoB-associated Cys-rich membrane protein [Lachnospiraceae bacterium OttesenSCG-928-E19]